MTTTTFQDLLREYGGGTEVVPDGPYDVVVFHANVVATRTNPPKQMIVCRCRVLHGPYANKVLMHNFVLTPDNPGAMFHWFRNFSILGLGSDYFNSLPPDIAQALQQIAADLVNKTAAVVAETSGSRQNLNFMAPSSAPITPQPQAPVPGPGMQPQMAAPQFQQPPPGYGVPAAPPGYGQPPLAPAASAPAQPSVAPPPMGQPPQGFPPGPATQAPGYPQQGVGGAPQPSYPGYPGFPESGSPNGAQQQAPPQYQQPPMQPQYQQPVAAPPPAPAPPAQGGFPQPPAQPEAQPPQGYPAPPGVAPEQAQQPQQPQAPGFPIPGTPPPQVPI